MEKWGWFALSKKEAGVCIKEKEFTNL